MIQTWALLLDAYRQLNAKKIFWITMILTLLVVVSFALVGINDKGIQIIAWDIELPGVNTSDQGGWTEAFFYKTLFNTLGINIWLAWIATVLGLITTAGIFPDFISSGSIDVVLSKPIGRFRLFLTKYVTGLLFVILQVGVFTICSFLIIGFRGGVWLPGIFIAIPLVVLFFSYLYAVCVLLGVLTRSTIAALMLTILFWFVVFLVQTTENSLLVFVIMREQKIQAFEKGLERSEERLKVVENPEDTERWDFLYKTIEQRKNSLEEERISGSGLILAHDIFVGIMTALPKTSQTIDLLERWTIDLAELPGGSEDDENEELIESLNEDGEYEMDDDEFGRALQQRLRERSPLWILGTSVLFELGMFLIAAWRFCRRDF